VNPRRRLIDYVVAAVLVAIPVVFLNANFRDPGKVNGFDRFVLKISAPLQRGVGWVIDGVAGAWHHYVWLVDVQKENDELRRENERLHRLLADATRQAHDASELAGLVELKQRLPAQSVGARVVAAGTNAYFRVTRIVLDRGEGEIQPGMPVVAPEGVVGRIHRVYGRYADVLLAVDPLSSIDVVLPRTNSRGVLKGVGGDNAYACKVAYLVRNDEVKEDDMVVTSGLGGVFPRDIPVGRVKKTEKNDYGMYLDVDVTPVVDFSHLSAVLVILAPPPPPDPTAKTKKTPEPGFGFVLYK
jgi:rod shape-determining protein MreC